MPRRPAPCAPLVGIACALGLLLGAAAPASASVPAALREPGALEAFFDGAIPTFLAGHGIEGGVVAVVQGEALVFAKGYGRTARLDGEPVTPDRTLFRVGSVSKLFVATAIMQLVEQGRLDLDRDVNEYLIGVRVPEAFGEPVTLRHLMTHTAGFEESALGRTWAYGPEDMPTLADELADYLPARVRPPGRVAAYSNHGTALAALVVEQVAGMPYDELLERQVLGPLGMTRTTSRQPIPDSIDGVLSRGDGGADDFAYVRVAPAGSISATANDIARFMSAHLGDGRLGGARILRAETARRMREPLFAHDARVAGMAHQFFRQRYGGQEIVGHDGGTLRHRTTLKLLPEHGIGFFASFNHGAAPTSVIDQAFLDFLFPGARTEPVPIAPELQTAGRVAGWYRSTRTSETSPTRVNDLITMGLVQADEQGRLLWAGETWLETEPGRFDRADGGDYFVVQEPGGEEPMRIFPGNLGAVAAERVPAWQGSVVQGAWLLVALIVLVAPVLIHPVRTLGRLREGSAAEALVAGLGLVTLVFAVSYGLGVAHAAVTYGGVGTPLRLALATTYLIAALVLLGAIVLVRSWTGSTSGARRRLGVALVAGIALVVWVDHWNLFLHRLQF